MVDLFALTDLLTRGCSVSGFEDGAENAVIEIAEKYFDEWYREPSGTYILTRKAKRENAPVIMLDAHMDEVGLLVTAVLEGGFLKVTNIGGVDSAIMQAADVTVYGKETLYGVVVSTPPHLQSGDRLALPKVNELLIDTGLSTEKARELIPIGTPVGFRFKLTSLQNNLICGKAFDDKICAVACIQAADILSKTDFDAELVLILSTKEEVSRAVITAAYRVMPNYALVLDVCSASVPDSASKRKSYLGEGPKISLSAITDVALTKRVIAYAKENGLKHTVTVEASGTGTNANDIPLVGCGIPTALVSIPLKYMHTYSEVISLDDVEDTAKLIAGFIEVLGKENA